MNAGGPVVDTKYHGWTNYETWLVNHYLIGNQQIYEHWVSRTRTLLSRREAADGGSDALQAHAVATLANDLATEYSTQLMNEVEAFRYEPGVLWRDLIRAAYSRVDWEQIATAVITGCDTGAAP